MAAARRKKRQSAGILPWIALLLLAVVVATFLYAHIHVATQHDHLMPPPRARRELEQPGLAATLEERSTTLPITTAPPALEKRRTINGAVHDLPPMDKLLEQSRMRFEAGKDVCSDDVFIVHWTHVPKAGGTAFAGMAKKISCARNPAIASSNPCCVRDVCVAEGSCHSTASTCPLVQGIGKHTSNMGRMALVPCCGREWYLSTVVSFLRYAMRPAPTEKDLAKFGLAYHPTKPFHPVKIKDATERHKAVKMATKSGTLAATAGMGRGSQLALRARGYAIWPVAKRVEFFAKTGVSWAELKKRMVEKKMTEGAEDDTVGVLRDLKTVYDRVALPKNMTYGGSQKHRFPRPGEPSLRARFCAKSTQDLVENIPRPHECCHKRGVGASSATMIRQPFVRGVSAFFYRGHNPNYDAYHLRPGLWVHPNDRKLYPSLIGQKSWTFKEYLGFPEYANVLTKMFGDSAECPQVQHCRRKPGSDISGTCDMVTGCHGYRNTTYLENAHVDAAVDTLKAHAFVGLLEAYNASVLLAAAEFNVNNLEEDDFALSRPSAALATDCSPSKVLRQDADACRAAFDAYALDNVVYERAHRLFCDRLDVKGLLDEEKVRVELRRRRLCGEVVYDDVEHVCGPLETPAAFTKLKGLRAMCVPGGAKAVNRKPRPREWWLATYGYHYDGQRTAPGG